MDVWGDLVLGCDWISSHDLQHLLQAGQVGLRSGPAQLQLALLPAAGRTVMERGERAPPPLPHRPPAPRGGTALSAPGPSGARSKGWREVAAQASRGGRALHRPLW